MTERARRNAGPCLTQFRRGPQNPYAGPWCGPVGPAMDDNIQPDGSWRDPTAQMAMDIGLGKVNPSGAGYAAVELAHQTYGSAHINGLWGHHGNAPAPAPSNDWWLGSPGSTVNRSAATTQSHAGHGANYQDATCNDASPGSEPGDPEISIDWKQVRHACLGFVWVAFCCLIIEFFRP